MKKIIKLGLGLAAGVATAYAAKEVYEKSREVLASELIAKVRECYENEEIQAAWIHDEAAPGGLYKGGLIFKEDEDNTALTYQINSKTLEITELERISLDNEN